MDEERDQPSVDADGPGGETGTGERGASSQGEPGSDGHATGDDGRGDAGTVGDEPPRSGKMAPDEAAEAESFATD